MPPELVVQRAISIFHDYVVGAGNHTARCAFPHSLSLPGKAIGPLGWVVTEDTVEYSYSASNGGGHYFYHDTNTGLTYQDSAYW
jgi:hypothetical protein